jgi:hypothetical protein
MHLEPAAKLGHRHVVDARCTFVLDDSSIRRPHVA